VIVAWIWINFNYDHVKNYVVGCIICFDNVLSYIYVYIQNLSSIGYKDDRRAISMCGDVDCLGDVVIDSKAAP
jgi:hypothetical protein